MSIKLIGTDGNTFAILANTRRFLQDIRDEDIRKQAVLEYNETIKNAYISMNYNTILAKCCNILDKYIKDDDSDEFN